MAISAVGPIRIPQPEGVDLSDADEFADNLKLLKMAFALGVAIFFMLGGRCARARESAFRFRI